MTDDLQSLVAAVVESRGLDLEEVALVGNERQRILKVVVDADGGVGIDAISQTSRALSRELDETGAMGEQRYTLEVTSRGVNNPLTEPRHWSRNSGRLVKVKTFDGESFTGRIRGNTDEHATLDVDGDERDLALTDIRKAVVQVELNRKDP